MGGPDAMSKNCGDVCKKRLLLSSHKRDYYCKGSEGVSDRKTGRWFVWLQMGVPCMDSVVLNTGGACETLRGQKHTHAGEQCV